MDVWLGMVGVMIAMDIAEIRELILSVTGGRHLLTARNCPDQNGHIDFEVRKVGAQSLPCLFHGLRLYVLYSAVRRTRMCTTT